MPHSSMSPDTAENRLWSCLAEIGVELHPGRVQAIATSLAQVTSYHDLGKARDAFGANDGASWFSKLQFAWSEAAQVSVTELAAALRGAAAAAAIQKIRLGNLDLVWSGPATNLIPVRNTEVVAIEVIEAAVNRLFLVSFVAYKPDNLIARLNAAIARGVRVDILLESGQEQGGKLNFDATARLKKSVPHARFLQWRPSQSNGGKQGAVHAKCIVADDRKAFITSANLTDAAMDDNMEVGVMISGGPLPRQLSDHFNAIIEMGEVTPI